jgi:hypothetical protein
MNDMTEGASIVAPTRRVIPIRASSIGELFDCAARWEAKYIRGMRLPSSGAAQLGTAVHKSTAVHDQSKLDGNPLLSEESVAAAGRRDPQARPGRDVGRRPLHENGRVDRARAAHEVLRGDRAEAGIRGGRSAMHASRSRTSRSRSRARRIASGAWGGFGIADLKTGKTAVRADGHVETAGHAMQQGVYELMAERAAGLPITEPALIIGMQTGKTDKGQRVAIAEVHGAREMLIGEPDAPGVLELASRVIHSGAFPGNPRSMLCSEKYCPAYLNCRFRR